jgi:hypothetical protein
VDARGRLEQERPDRPLHDEERQRDDDDQLREPSPQLVHPGHADVQRELALLRPQHDARLDGRVAGDARAVGRDELAVAARPGALGHLEAAGRQHALREVDRALRFAPEDDRRVVLHRGPADSPAPAAAAPAVSP